MVKKITITQLQTRLKEAELSSHNWQDDYYEQRTKIGELQEEIQKLNRKEIDGLTGRNYRIENETERLVNIIRWLIEPTTADTKIPERCPQCGFEHNKGRNN